MKQRHLRAGLVACFLIAGCGDGSGGSHVVTSPSSGGASGGGATTGGGGTGALPAYCDCLSEGDEASDLAEELACFCQTYDCPSFEEVPESYERTECVEGIVLYESNTNYEDFLFFRGGELVGYSKRFSESPCGGQGLAVGETSCLTGNLCGDQGGAGGCRLVY